MLVEWLQELTKDVHLSGTCWSRVAARINTPPGGVWDYISAHLTNDWVRAFSLTTPVDLYMYPSCFIHPPFSFLFDNLYHHVYVIHNLEGNSMYGRTRYSMRREESIKPTWLSLTDTFPRETNDGMGAVSVSSTGWGLYPHQSIVIRTHSYLYHHPSPTSDSLRSPFCRPTLTHPPHLPYLITSPRSFPPRASKDLFSPFFSIRWGSRLVVVLYEEVEK